MIERLSDVTVLALAKAVDDGERKTAREAVPAGRYEIDATVRLHGVITVAADYQGKFSSAIPWRQLCEFVLSEIHPSTRKALLRRFEAGERGDSSHAAALTASMVEQTARTCKGAVRAEMIVSCLEEALEAEVA